MKLSIVKRGKRHYFNVINHHKALFNHWICLDKVAVYVVFILSFQISSIITWKYLTKNYPIIVKCKTVEVQDISPILVPTVTPTPKQWTGKVSYYSKDGCIGCNELQITASGEVFDENANTLAFNKLPLNTEVLVTNLNTGVSQVALVNDRGGFEKYNRIADLSKGLFQRLGAKTDVTNIKIEEIK